MTLHTTYQKSRLEQKIVGDMIGTTYANSRDHSSFRGGITSIKKHQVDKEIVTKVLLRTCSYLYARVKENDCGGLRNPATVWSFAGIVGTSNLLLPAWDGTTTNVFSCGSIDAYGRGLIQKAIPRAFIANGNYRYDFRGMSATDGVGVLTGSRTEPCGYTEIVDIQ